MISRAQKLEKPIHFSRPVIASSLPFLHQFFVSHLCTVKLVSIRLLFVDRKIKMQTTYSYNGHILVC